MVVLSPLYPVAFAVKVAVLCIVSVSNRFEIDNDVPLMLPIVVGALDALPREYVMPLDPSFKGVLLAVYVLYFVADRVVEPPAAPKVLVNDPSWIYLYRTLASCLAVMEPDFPFQLTEYVVLAAGISVLLRFEAVTVVPLRFMYVVSLPDR